MLERPSKVILLELHHRAKLLPMLAHLHNPRDLFKDKNQNGLNKPPNFGKNRIHQE